MAHWGWYWKVKKQHILRKLCSQLPFIDSFKLYRGTCKYGFTVHPLDVKAKAGEDHLKITYRTRKSLAYIIPIEKNPCNYGGFRYFFKCPLCQKRMRFLYFAEQSIFLCRLCLNLGYNSQRLCPSGRLEEQGEKIQKQIKDKGGDIGKKPPRMHWSTWNSLIEKKIDYEIRAKDALRSEIVQLYGPRFTDFL